MEIIDEQSWMSDTQKGKQSGANPSRGKGAGVRPVHQSAATST